MNIIKVDKGSSLSTAVQEFSNRHSLLFNTTAWMNNYPENAISQCAILNNNGDVIGCFIYYRFRKYFLDFIITPPYAPHIDLFYINPATSIVGKNSFSKDVSELLAAYFHSLQAHYIDINLPEEISDTQPFIWKGFRSGNRYSYLIDLSVSETTLKENLSPEKRKSLNKAQKDKVEVETSDNYDVIHDLVIKSLERSDANKNPLILKNIICSFANEYNAYSFVASDMGKPVASSFCVKARNKAIYLFGGTNKDNTNHGAGVTCMWQSILKARELGLKYFDFEGSMKTGIERYFREFGGELRPYYFVEKISPFLKVLLHLKGHRNL